MADKNIDTVLLSVGHDLPYLTGYTAMPLERLTMLAVHSTGVPVECTASIVRRSRGIAVYPVR